MSAPAAIRQRAPRTGSIDALVVAVGLSTFGSGLVYPYTAVYFAAMPAVGAGGVALYFAVLAGTNFLAAVGLAASPGSRRPADLVLTGAGLLVGGYAFLVVGHHLALVVGAAVVIGLGQGLFSAGLAPLIGALVPAEERRTAFARRYRAMNLGLSLGAVAGGGVTALLGLAALPYLFGANAMSFVPLVVFAAAVRRRPARADPPPDQVSDLGAPAAPGDPVAQGTGGGSIRRAIACTVLFQLGACLFGFSQFEATAPLVATGPMQTPLATASLLLLVNAVAVIVLQKPITALLKGRSEPTGLRATTLLWAAAFLVAGASAAGGLWIRIAGLVALALLFAVGECAYGYSYHPWLVGLVDERHVTRLSSLSNAMSSVGAAAGPALGVALLTTGSGTVVFWVMAACCAATTLLATGAAAAAPRRPIATGVSP